MDVVRDPSHSRKVSVTNPMPTAVRTAPSRTLDPRPAVVPAVVVAVDDAEPTPSADLRIAVAEARRRGASIRVVHGCATTSPAGIIGASVTDERLRYGQYVLTQAVRILRELSGFKVDIATVNSRDLGTELLLAESQSASLVVVLHTRTSLVRSMAGSTAAVVAARARCPVLVVHPGDTAEIGTGVVVAAEDPGASTALLRLAAAESVGRGASLTVVRPWPVPDDRWAAARELSRGVSSAVAEDVAHEELARAVQDLAADFPTLTVLKQLVCGSPVEVLVAASADASILVLGRPEDPSPQGELPEMAAALLSRAHCPVLVVQPTLVGSRPDTTSSPFGSTHPTPEPR